MKRSATIIVLFLLSGMVLIPAPVFSEMTSETTKKGEPEIERLFMGGTEIQGTVEKPHVVYIVPWSEGANAEEREIPFERSFKEEILAPVDQARFQSQWGSAPEARKGGEKQ